MLTAAAVGVIRANSGAGMLALTRGPNGSDVGERRERGD
jgi:hypothetical protein